MFKYQTYLEANRVGIIFYAIHLINIILYN